MKRLKILIFLKDPVIPFNFPQELFRQLSLNYTDFDFVMIDSTEQFLEQLNDASIVVTWIFKQQWYLLSSRLFAVLTPAAGKDWVEEDPMQRVSVYHGTFHGNLIAESVLAMILYFNRKLYRLVTNQQMKIWDRNVQSNTRSLWGQHILIVGYGIIARAVARLLSVFHCSTKGLQRTYTDGIDSETGVEYITSNQFDDALAWADHVIAILPQSNSTTNFFTRRHFRLMKNSACFYNVGRGNCYREHDLIQSLLSREIAGAGMDVFNTEPLPSDSALWNLDTVLITPHSACIYQDYMYAYYTELEPLIHQLAKSCMGEDKR